MKLKGNTGSCLYFYLFIYLLWTFTRLCTLNLSPIVRMLCCSTIMSWGVYGRRLPELPVCAIVHQHIRAFKAQSFFGHTSSLPYCREAVAILVIILVIHVPEMEKLSWRGFFYTLEETKCVSQRHKRKWTCTEKCESNCCLKCCRFKGRLVNFMIDYGLSAWTFLTNFVQFYNIHKSCHLDLVVSIHKPECLLKCQLLLLWYSWV